MIYIKYVLFLSLKSEGGQQVRAASLPLSRACRYHCPPLPPLTSHARLRCLLRRRRWYGQVETKARGRIPLCIPVWARCKEQGARGDTAAVVGGGAA